MYKHIILSDIDCDCETEQINQHLRYNKSYCQEKNLAAVFFSNFSKITKISYH